MRRKSLPVVWRDAIGDSELDSTAKLVAYQFTRWMNGRGACYPSRREIAAKASLSVRAVDLAIRRLHEHGWLLVERSRGRRTNVYCAILASTANEMRRSEWADGASDALNGASNALNGKRPSPEDVLKTSESAAPSAAAALTGSATAAPERERLVPDEPCFGCGARAVGPDFRYCAECQQAIDALAAEGAR